MIVAHQRKIEGRTAFENNVLGEGVNNVCERSNKNCSRTFSLIYYIHRSDLLNQRLLISPKHIS